MSMQFKKGEYMSHKMLLSQAEAVTKISLRALVMRIAVVAYLATLSALLLPSAATASGKKYSSQGARLTQAINESLLSKGMCQTPRQCHDLLPGTLETDSKVVIQFFQVGALNQPAFLAAVSLTLSSGMKITEGIPIKIEAFRESHDEYRKSGVIMKAVKPFATIEVSS